MPEIKQTALRKGRRRRAKKGTRGPCNAQNREIALNAQRADFSQCHHSLQGSCTSLTEQNFLPWTVYWYEGPVLALRKLVGCLPLLLRKGRPALYFYAEGSAVLFAPTWKVLGLFQQSTKHVLELRSGWKSVMLLTSLMFSTGSVLSRIGPETCLRTLAIRKYTDRACTLIFQHDCRGEKHPMPCTSQKSRDFGGHILCATASYDPPHPVLLQVLTWRPASKPT